jgi:PAS domain S-box-containing protein
MHELDPPQDERRERDRLIDEVEQLRAALESSQDEVTHLAEERDRLLRRVTAQSRELQSANAAYQRAGEARVESPQLRQESRASEEEEELRVAFEEMQVLTEELEVANTNLEETNRALDRRVAERTAELARKNLTLAETELRFRTLVEGIPQLAWRSASGGRWTWASPQWVAFTGLAADHSLDQGWLVALHPEDRDHARAAWAEAHPGLPLDFAGRILSSDGTYRHFRIRAIAVPGADGGATEWLGTCTDVNDLLTLQERQKLLLAELQHRVRNILTVVRSVFTRTVDTADVAEEMADHFRGRLDSLARTQVVVTQSAQGKVDLESLIRDELLSVGATDGPSVAIEGPDVLLPGKTAELIGLAVHELTTNSLKYGALKVAGAKLQIRWSVDLVNRSQSFLHLSWAEKGVPAVPVQPVRHGFGTELITEALPYQLGARTKLEFKGGGVHCTISAPLPSEEEQTAVLRQGTPVDDIRSYR